MSIPLSPAANVPGPGTAPCLRWWRGRGSWSRDRGRRSRSVLAGGRGPERGYYTLAAAGCWPPLVIATLAS